MTYFQASISQDHSITQWNKVDLASGSSSSEQTSDLSQSVRGYGRLSHFFHRYLLRDIDETQEITVGGKVYFVETWKKRAHLEASKQGVQDWHSNIWKSSGLVDQVKGMAHYSKQKKEDHVLKYDFPSKGAKGASAVQGQSYQELKDEFDDQLGSVQNSISGIGVDGDWVAKGGKDKTSIHIHSGDCTTSPFREKDLGSVAVVNAANPTMKRFGTSGTNKAFHKILNTGVWEHAKKRTWEILGRNHLKVTEAAVVPYVLKDSVNKDDKYNNVEAMIQVLAPQLHKGADLEEAQVQVYKAYLNAFQLAGEKNGIKHVVVPALAAGDYAKKLSPGDRKKWVPMVYDAYLAAAYAATGNGWIDTAILTVMTKGDHALSPTKALYQRKKGQQPFLDPKLPSLKLKEEGRRQDRWNEVLPRSKEMALLDLYAWKPTAGKIEERKKQVEKKWKAHVKKCEKDNLRLSEEDKALMKEVRYFRFPNKLPRVATDLYGDREILRFPAPIEYTRDWQEIDETSLPVRDYWPLETVTAAPNLGDADFSNFSKKVKTPHAFGLLSLSQNQLDEDAYVSYMGQKFEDLFQSREKDKVDISVDLPLGLGAFIRDLPSKDARYKDPDKLAILRLRVAQQYWDKAAAYVKRNPGKEVHFCAVPGDFGMPGEATENYNAFVGTLRGREDLEELRGKIFLHTKQGSGNATIATQLCLRNQEKKNKKKVDYLVAGAKPGITNRGDQAYSAFRAQEENAARRSPKALLVGHILNDGHEHRKRVDSELSGRVNEYGGQVIPMEEEEVEEKS